MRCAVEVQRGMADRNVETPDDKRIRFPRFLGGDLRLMKVGSRKFALDSALEGDGFELPVREHRAMAPSHGFAAACHREARARPPPQPR